MASLATREPKVEPAVPTNESDGDTARPIPPTETQPQTAPFPALPNACFLYRAITKRAWYKNGELSLFVFTRRPPKDDGTERDTDGLSVMLVEKREVQSACETEAALFTDCRAVSQIATGAVRALSPPSGTNEPLDAVQDRRYHANITGLPKVPLPSVMTPEGVAARDKAQVLGGELANRAVVVWTKP